MPSRYAPPPARAPEARARLHTAAACLLFLALGAVLFPSAGRDDAYITAWSATTLADHGAILNYSGVPLEQGSSLLHVLVLALARLVTGLPVPALGAALSVAFGCLTLPFVRRLVPDAPPRVAVVATYLAATATPLLYWSFGGLETSLVAAIGTLLYGSVIVLLRTERVGPRRVLALGALLLAHLLARPEAVFVLGAFLGLVLGGVAFGERGARRTRSVRRLLALGGAALALFGVIAAARLAAFGSLFPQPVIAKAGGLDAVRVKKGVVYLAETLVSVPSLALLAALAGAGLLLLGRARLLRRPPDVPFLVVAAALGAGLLFTTASGGDWMEGGRFFAPVVPLLAALAAAGIAALGPPLRRVLPAAAVALQVLFAAQFAVRGDSTCLPAWRIPGHLHRLAALGIDTSRFGILDLANLVHLRDVPLILALEDILASMEARGEAPARIFSYQGGMVPYHLAAGRPGRFRFIDGHGLTSADLTACEVTAVLQHTSDGLILNHDFIFKRLTQIQERCGLPPIDIVFGLDYGGRRRPDVLNRGYRLAYLQDGPLAEGDAGARVSSEQFIAVRADLFLRLGLRERRFSWDPARR